MLSRRQLVAMAGALTAAWFAPALLESPPHLTLWSGRATADTADLTLARFTPYVGSEFEIRTGGAQAVRVTLAEATARTPRPADRPGLVGESFSLVFAGNGTKAFDHGTQRVVHPALGAFPLYLVAVDRGLRSQHYQAVVDRRTPPR
jgi:hypothetical protein